MKRLIIILTLGALVALGLSIATLAKSPMGRGQGNIITATSEQLAGDTRAQYYPGNPDCEDIGCGDTLPDGTVSITYHGNTLFDWDSTPIPVKCVIVKGGPNANVYYYDPPSTSDTGLHPPVNSNNDSLYAISHIEFCDPDDPVPVTLSSFTSKVEEGAVVLSWTTGSETENLGYHVYRGLTPDGAYERVTHELIEGAGSSRTTQRYQFIDEDVKEGVTYYYRLEQLDFDGTKQVHGPIPIAVAKPAVLNRTWGWVKSVFE